jgi:hypothetical protein
MKKTSLVIMAILILSIAVRAEDISQEQAATSLKSAMGNYWASDVSIEKYDENDILDIKITIINANAELPDWAWMMKVTGAVSRIMPKIKWRTDKVIVILPEERGGGIWMATTADCKKCGRIGDRLAKEPALLEEYTNCVTSIWNKEESVASEIDVTNSDLPLDVDYSGYDTLTKLKAKNPDITFSQIKYPYENKGRTQFKTVLGQSPITTEATFTFNSKGRLVNVIIKKKGAALDVYEPLVEKYTQIYGNPKSSTPFTTDLRQNASFATCSWENEERDTLLLLIIPLDGYSVPSIKLVENWKDK